MVKALLKVVLNQTAIAEQFILTISVYLFYQIFNFVPRSNQVFKRETLLLRFTPFTGFIPLMMS